MRTHKVYYVTHEILNDRNGTHGVARKIITQIDSMCLSGFDCEYYYLPFVLHESLITKIKRRIPYMNVHRHWRIDERLESANGLYIRRLGEIDAYVIDFLHNIRKRNPQIRIVWEIPTYPYDKEITTKLRDYPVYWKDLYGRKKLHHVVDRIATLTKDEKIFGINTLHIDNGFDFSHSRTRSLKQIEKRNIIHCIAVAGMAFWHGYDRFIEGLHNYYTQGGSRNIAIHFVGDGPEIPKYRNYVSKYKLEEHVIFHGVQYGEALDAIYDQCTLGIASLGWFRSGIKEAMPIKTREYMAKGIPFISSVRISDISEQDAKDIYLKVPNDESPVDIPNVLAFYDRIYSSSEADVIRRIRRYAEENFSMEKAMKNVIDYFKSGTDVS